MTPPKVLAIKTARRPSRPKEPRSMEQIVDKARREYARLKDVAETEPDHLVSGDPSRIHQEHDDDAE